jgi:DNA-binding response OmpR family regulator
MKSKRLLIIETDDPIRELTTRWLTEAGYVIARDDARAGGIALVIADIQNPALADSALRDLRARYGSPILATSGRFRRGTDSVSAARRLGVAKVLPKPFTCGELLAAVEDCLGNG